jgi:hypothetical protein
MFCRIFWREWQSSNADCGSGKFYEMTGLQSENRNFSIKQKYMTFELQDFTRTEIL